MLPAEFKMNEYRFSFRRHTADGYVYSGAKLEDGFFRSIGELAVRKGTTKPALYRLFILMEEIINRPGAQPGQN